MKSNQRLEMSRLAEALEERQLVDSATIQHILNQSASTGELFTEILVREGLISDWELAYVASDLFNLPFLPLGNFEVDPEILKDLDQDFLRQNCLVPVSRFGKVLTVSMPGIVSVDALQVLRKQCDCMVMPVAGSVSENRHWLDTNMPAEAEALSEIAAALPSAMEEGDWANIFDAGDEAVRMQLLGEDDDPGGSSPKGGSSSGGSGGFPSLPDLPDLG